MEKVTEFAKDGERSIVGLDENLGFPRDEKPARQWFNSLFNKATVKTNEIIDAIDGIITNATETATNLVDLQSLVEQINGHVTDLLNAPVYEAYAVGDIYVTTKAFETAEAVALHHKYGVWQRYGEGKALVGKASSDTTSPVWTKTIGTTTGAYTHKLTANELPSAGFLMREAGWHNAREHGAGGTGYASGTVRNTFFPIPSSSTGWNDDPHNIVQPSIVAGMWVRTA